MLLRSSSNNLKSTPQNWHIKLSGCVAWPWRQAMPWQQARPSCCCRIQQACLGKKNSLSVTLSFSLCFTVNKLPYILAQATPSLGWRSINRLYKAPVATAAPETWLPSAATKWPFWKLLNFTGLEVWGIWFRESKTHSQPSSRRGNLYSGAGLHKHSYVILQPHYKLLLLRCHTEHSVQFPTSSHANMSHSGRLSYMQSNLKLRQMRDLCVNFTQGVLSICTLIHTQRKLGCELETACISNIMHWH